MPSPFPGMDPYLEDPILWPGLHQRLITYLADALNAVLPPRYVADMGERLYLAQPRCDIYADVAVLKEPALQVPTAQSEAGTAAAPGAPSDLPWVLTVEPVEVREVFVEILSLVEGERLVTTIEVLSPSNKMAGSEGRKFYLTQQQEILPSQIHLIEIDLLRQGEHTVAAPREHLLRQGRWHYLVCLHRGGQGGRYEVWPIMLQQRLPRMRVPLADGDPDIVLDLQAVFNRSYDEGAYVRRLDYRREPRASLTGDDADWATALLG